MSTDQTPNEKSAMARPRSLGRHAVKAGAWVAIEVGLGHAFRLANNLIMTRLLLPEAFGLMAMVVTIQVGLVMLTDLGIHLSIVQSDRGDDPRFLRVAWVVQMLRGGAIAALVVLASVLLWLFAPHFAPDGTVYADPRLPGLIALSSLVMLFRGIESPNQFLAERRLHYSRIVILGLASQIVGLIAMISFAALSPSVWALLVGMLTSSVFRAGLSHRIFVGPRMRIEWDKDIADELWHFGKWIILSSAFGFFAINADRLILAALLEKETFGLYVVAFMWVQAAGVVLQKISGTIGPSYFSEVRRNNAENIRNAFRRFISILDLFVVPFFLAMAVGGPLLIEFLYTAEFEKAAVFIPFLALGILVKRFDAISALVLSRGDSRSMMWVAAIQAVAICTLIPVGFATLGIEGALLATALTPLIGAPVLIAKLASIPGVKKSIDVIVLVAILLIAAAVYLIYSPI